MILENMVFQYIDEENGERIRIINIDVEYKFLYYVSLDLGVSMPKKQLIEKVESEINNNILVRIPEPFLQSIDEERVSEIQKEKRDFQWLIVEKHWHKDKEKLIETRGRQKILGEIAIENDVTVSSIKRIFSRYWQRGMNKNALLPDYMNSGGKGKSKKLKLDSKIGRAKI